MTTTEQDIVLAMRHIASSRAEEAGEILSRIVEQERMNAMALHGLGVVAYTAKDYETAIRHLTLAVQIDGKNPHFGNNLGEALRRANRLEEALAAFEKVLLVKPDFLKAHLGAGNALRDLGRVQEASARYRLALAIDASFAEAYNYLGALFAAQERVDDAIPLLRKAVALRPEYPEAQLGLANALEHKGLPEEALAIYRQMLERDPKNTSVHNNAGNILKSLGRIDEAVTHYRHALDADPTHASAFYNLSRAKVGAEGDDLARMEALLEDPKLTAEQRVPLLFGLAKIHDDLGNYEKAFHYIEEGNTSDTRGEPFNADRHSAAMNRLIAVFSKAFFANRKGMGSETEVPVFILGMPRSGTTLVEQTLASHPEVFGAGELDHMGRIIASMPDAVDKFTPYPEFATMVDAVTACRLGEDYLSRLRLVADDARRVTDKMPANFLNLGFIALLLPRAKIIHCRRDAMDTCLSCYSQHFTSVMPFSRSQASLGRYYRDYERLMAHWREVLPLPVYDVQYEDMVADHAKISRELVDFCGLEWDDACIDFHKTDRKVKTASSWQVRQPIYTTSLARWRNYEPFLGPLKEALGDAYPDEPADAGQHVNTGETHGRDTGTEPARAGSAQD